MSEKDDFQKLIGGVKKITQPNTSREFYQQKPQNTDKKQYAERFEHSQVSQFGYEIGVEDMLEYRRDGVQHMVMKKLAKGEMTIYESIDLHGMTTLEAEVYMHNTIDSLRFPHTVAIRIVHGKGYHAGEQRDNKPNPKLKNFTARYLTENTRVLAYVSCPPNRGGTGAVYVLLSRFEN